MKQICCLHDLRECCVFSDREKILLGTEEGLILVDIPRDNVIKIGERKSVSQVEVVPDEQLIITISGLCA